MAGLGIAHRLLKYTLPKCKDLKVIIVSKVLPTGLPPAPVNLLTIHYTE